MYILIDGEPVKARKCQGGFRALNEANQPVCFHRVPLEWLEGEMREYTLKKNGHKYRHLIRGW